MIRTKQSLAKWSTVLGLAAVGVVAAAQDRYEIIDLGAPNGAIGSRPKVISINGTIMGESYPGESISSAWIYKDGSIAELGVLGSDITAHVYGINGSDIGIGSSGEFGTEKGFLWDNGMTQIVYVLPDPIPIMGVPPPVNYPDEVDPLRGIDINDAGNFVYSGSAGGLWTSFWFNLGDNPFALPYNPAIVRPGTDNQGRNIFALAMNNNNIVVGNSLLPTGAVEAFWWKPPTPGAADGQFQDVTVKRNGDTNCEAVDINDLDWAVGSTGRYFRPQLGTVDYYLPVPWIVALSFPADFCVPPRYYLPLLPGDFLGEARGINNSGMVVGRSGVFTADSFVGQYDYRGVIWYPTACSPFPLPVEYVTLPLKLDNFIPPGSGWHIIDATAINDFGQITAVAIKDNQVRSVLLNPIRFPVGLVLDPKSIPGGAPVTATVTIDKPAPAGGTELTVTSSNPVATVPATVTVPAGETEAEFTVTTVGVNQFTPALISVSNAGHTKSAQLSVQKTAVTALQLTSPITGGLTTTGKVVLNGRAPAGNLRVNLTSNFPLVAKGPAIVTVLAGEVERTFTITTYPVLANKVVRFTATANGVTRAADLLVRTPFLSDLTLSQNTVIGGNNVTGQVKLTYNANPGGASVTVFSSNPSVAAVPNAVLVPAGVRIRNFVIVTQPVNFDTNITVTATFNGGTKTKPLLVTPDL